MKYLNRFGEILKDYCLNSSLAGFRYIADPKYHYTERIFWQICIILSWTGSFFLIRNTLYSFDTNSISLVVESIRPMETTPFPSIAVCEMGYTKEIYEDLENIVNQLKPNPDVEYNYDVEDFMLRVIFHNLYNFGSITSYCAPYSDCENCIKCPVTGYSKFAEEVRTNCSTLFETCMWNGKKFDCCNYFLPIQTTLGQCYLLNSIQTTNKYSKHWLNMIVGIHEGSGLLSIDVTKAIALYIINEEDVPHLLLTSLQFMIIPTGFEGSIQMSLQNTINDLGVRDINPKLRKCIFPDENNDSKYKYYSFTTCVTECLKNAQIKACNCSHYNMIYDEYDESPSCNYSGLFCLDQKDLLHPQTTIMQPWRSNGLGCHCLPSCTENELKLIGYSSSIVSGKINRSISISLQSVPTQRYRRQAVREPLDIVVSIGGIMGLFMGASILSGVEVLYFLTVRLLGTFNLKKQHDQQQK